MFKKMFGIAATSLMAALLAMSPAKAATVYDFTFSSSALNATGTLDVVGTDAVDGTGEATSPFWLGPETLTLVTLSTPGVHDLGGGELSYRFGGGTDLIGDTSVPVDNLGLVFIVTDPNDVGANFWVNFGTNSTGFLAGNSGIYNAFDGTLTLTVAQSQNPGQTPLPAALPLFGTALSGLGFLSLLARKRKQARTAVS